MWVTPSKPECYGKMFPDLQARGSGAVFSWKEQAGKVRVNHEHWTRCEGCHWYRYCYDLGLARALFESRLSIRRSWSSED